MSQSFNKATLNIPEGMVHAPPPIYIPGLQERAIQSVQQVADNKPENPVFVFRPQTLSKAILYFQANFQAEQLYAVKTNPDPLVIQILKNHQVLSYDVASLSEIKLIKSHIPEAKLYFMHPVKSPEAIAQAYFNYGVRHFSLDSFEELEKIIHKTQFAKDLHLHLRLAIPNHYSEMNLTKKFGIHNDTAPALLRAMSQQASKVGICFHVGSQCMNPLAYQIAIGIANEVIKKADVPVSYLNVGGGFPAIYPNMQPPALREYFTVIQNEHAALKKEFPNLELLSEPGRALVAECTSLIVRVELRKDNYLYVNDGTYGGLFDAGVPGFIYPTRLLRSTAQHSNLKPFHLYGPTCDSLDYMPGPFHLPADITTGDYIEIGQLGAYSRTLATQFNGFRHEEKIILVNDEPLITLYNHN